MEFRFPTRFWKWMCYFNSNRSLPGLRRHADIQLGGMGEFVRIFGVHSRFEGVPPECKSQTSPLEINCPVSTCGPILGAMGHHGAEIAQWWSRMDTVVNLRVSYETAMFWPLIISFSKRKWFHPSYSYPVSIKPQFSNQWVCPLALLCV
jgi:hypothetical protein